MNLGLPQKSKHHAVEGSPSYAAVAAIAASNPGIKISARANLKGDIIITTKDQDSASLLHTEASFTYVDPAKKLSKAIVVNYPVNMSLSFITDCSQVAQAERHLGSHKQPTRSVTVTFIGPIPKTLDPRLWGSFPTNDFTSDPLRCFNCQRFGHHKEDCRSPAICSRCHATQVCIDAHKNGIESQVKCPNCAGPHHAWNKKCPEFLRRVSTPQAAPPTFTVTAP
ncbi:uncharacterized protein [Palaemon carinicauda]|uniref:uncharacterized protein n=1 Tax=Palaemon carinicauda TaxID=392227 RepID=UPI0035B66E21